MSPLDVPIADQLTIGDVLVFVDDRPRYTPVALSDRELREAFQDRVLIEATDLRVRAIADEALHNEAKALPPTKSAAVLGTWLHLFFKARLIVRGFPVLRRSSRSWAAEMQLTARRDRFGRMWYYVASACHPVSSLCGTSRPARTRR